MSWPTRRSATTRSSPTKRLRRTSRDADRNATRLTILVPRGPEAAAVRRAGVAARIVELPAGAAAVSALPELEAGETVIALGLCGALWRMTAGDVAIYGRVVDASASYVLDAAVVDELSARLPEAAVVNACTTRSVVTNVEARAALAQRFNAEVVDMEGTHLAAALADSGVRFGIVRVVSDDASRDLPPIERVVDAEGRLQPMAIALAFARAPLAAFRFVRDVRSGLGVLTAVARALSDAA